MSKKTKLELTWIGKDQRPRLEPRVLVEDPAKSYHAEHRVSENDFFDNRLIFGDNLLALKALEQEFTGKIKCIYIDPPFNTGQAFEHYDDGIEHSLWLSMMRDRLELLWRLLDPNGSLWIHCDDSEAHYLKVLCDECFGRAFFVAGIVWQKRTSRENRAAIGSAHDYILLYAKCGAVAWKDVRNRLPPNEAGYSNPDDDPRGPWRSIPFSAQGFRPNQMYDIETPTGKILSPPKGRCWGATEPVFRQFLADNRVYFPKNGEGRPRIKQFKGEEQGLVPMTWWDSSMAGDNERGKKEILALHEGDDPFSTPKPESLVSLVVQVATSPRIKRLSEYVGESYFEYLSKLDDLVLLMDESHRYRAQAGMRALNELKPILGLEVTATPQIMQGQKVIPFKNVIYSYPLSQALEDGFVKAPAVATRENFVASNYDEAALERLKLEDGIHIHEETKVQLEVYARETGGKRVKPFMLVVAKDTTHAGKLREIIESDDFFAGQYKGKVAEVHSNQRGEERDENVQKLLAVENPDDETKIVIHVDQLKEGWDVTNLYTIVPLRPFNSRTLIEQAIGRGLRLPYGKRVGVPAVDRLTIVSHDKFQEIIDEANRGDSILKMGLVLIGKDIPDKHSKAVTVPTNLEQRLIGTPGEDGQPKAQQKPLFDTEAEKKAAQATLEAIQHFERLPRSTDLQSQDVQKEIAERVKEAIKPMQPELPGTAEEVDVEQVVAEVTKQFVEMSIDIPRIVIVPSDDATYGFRDFPLDCKHIRLQPVSQDILIQNLQNNDRYKLQGTSNVATEVRLEDYLVRELIDFDDISYDEHARLLYKLAGEMVAHLRSYLANDDEVLNVLLAHNRRLVDTIYAQMQEHYYETATSYEVKVTKGFRTLHSTNVLTAADENVRHFREPVDDKKYIRGMLFGSFARCLYPSQKFDSDSERRFSVLLEDDRDNVLKWFKPGRNVFQIHWRCGIEEGDYEPDFVVETKTAKYLCEPKAKNEMTDPVVVAKADAAAEWCHHASQVSDKPWSYLLIPHDAIDSSKTLAGLAGTYTYHRKVK